MHHKKHKLDGHDVTDQVRKFRMISTVQTEAISSKIIPQFTTHFVELRVVFPASKTQSAQPRRAEKRGLFQPARQYSAAKQKAV